jgi:hypothetical protein
MLPLQQRRIEAADAMARRQAEQGVTGDEIPSCSASQPFMRETSWPSFAL